MNPNISQSNSSLSFSEHCQSESPTIYTSSDEIDEIELRIINWLNKHEITITVPEEKEYKYYEDCRKKHEHINSFMDRTLSSIHDSPLLQRRNSVPWKDLHQKSPVKKKLSSPKVSKFRTYKFLEFDDKNELFQN